MERPAAGTRPAGPTLTASPTLTAGLPSGACIVHPSFPQPHPSVQRVVLTGFMGAGKSTVGPMLAQELGWRFVDIDCVIEEAEGASISDLFRRLGENGFRTLEAGAIKTCLKEDLLVLALGGGAVETPSTRELLLSTPGTRVLFLETPLPAALARCQAQAADAVRPLLADPDALAARFAAREQHYRQAHHTLSTDGRTPAEVAALALLALS